LDPRIKRLSFVSSPKRNATEELLCKKYDEMKSTMKAEATTTTTDEEKQSQKKTSRILANSKEHDSPICSDEVTEYLLLEEIDLERNPFTWWKKRKGKFPVLYRLAMKYFSVYTSLTVNEKMFSDANNLLTDKEAGISSELFKYLIFLKQNNKNLDSIHSES